MSSRWHLLHDALRGHLWSLRVLFHDRQEGALGGVRFGGWIRGDGLSGCELVAECTFRDRFRLGVA
jgi:hypothetical protein